MSTLIEKLSVTNNTESPIFEFDETKLSKYILDLSLDLEIRIKSLELYYKENKEDTIEIISRITGMYQFSGTKIIQNFLNYICLNTVNISTFLKLECAKSLLSFTEFEEDITKNDDKNMIEIKTESNKQIQERNQDRQKIGYKALNNVCSIIIKDIEFPTPCKIDSICSLMETDVYKLESDLYFRYIINDLNIDCDYRYKTILSLEKKKLLNFGFYITNACLDFLNNINNRTLYRILSGQYLLQNCTDIDKEHIYKVLYGFATDENLDYNLRADSADTLLTFGTYEVKEQARKVIEILGSIEGVVKTIFDNAQNVHVKEIEKSVAEILEVLLMNKTMIVGENTIDFEFVKNKIKNILKDEIPKNEINKSEKEHNTCCNCKIICEDEFCSINCKKIFKKHKRILLSLNRIEMDRTLYSKMNSNISNIIVKLWSYINESEFVDQLTIRLLQELDDMSGTCSSGFISRLVNTLSGFGDLSIKISFNDQIISNFVGRLNMYARKITDIDSPFRANRLYDVIEIYAYSRGIVNQYKNIKNMKELINEYLKTDRDNKIDEILDYFEEQVLNEMTLETTKFNDRRHFLMFFREYMLRIREELYEEFKDFVTDTEFDLCIRKAISNYEGVQHLI